MKEVEEDPGVSYKKMITDSSIPLSKASISLPRDKIRVEKAHYSSKKSASIDKCEISSILELNFKTNNFIKVLKLISSLTIVLANDKILSSWSKMVNKIKGSTIISYDTTYYMGDY